MKSSKEISVNVISARNSGQAPDGGYGWVIVAASFLCNVVVYGIAKNYGIFLVYFVDYYQSSETELAWIGSLFIGCMQISGPLGGAMINAFGSRPVIITGSILSAVAFLISTQASNAKVLICTYGIMGGVGFGLINTPAVVNVGLYFSSKRATATGIAMCGIGVGSFVIPSLSTLLLEFYDWQGTIIIFAGLILNCVVFGALMRSLPAYSETRHLWDTDIAHVSKNNKHHADVSHNHIDFDKKRNINTMSNIEAESAKYSIADESFSQYDAESRNSADDLQIMGLLIASKSNTFQQASALDVHEVLDENAAQVNGKGSTSKNKNNGDTTLGVAVLKDLGTEYDIKTRLRSISFVQCCNSPVSSVQQRIPSASSKFSRVVECVLVTLKETFDVSLLKEVPFLLLCSSYVVGMIGLLIPYVFLPHNSITKGIGKENAAFLLSVIGVADLVGRLIFGYIADRPHIRPLDVNNVCVFVSGMTSLAIPFCFSYPSIVLASALYGFFAAGYQCLPSILSIDMVGLERLTNAFGLVCLFKGIGCIVGSPVAGSLFKGTGNNDMLFYMAGALLIMSGGLTMIIPCLTCSREKSCYGKLSRPVSHHHQDLCKSQSRGQNN